MASYAHERGGHVWTCAWTNGRYVFEVHLQHEFLLEPESSMTSVLARALVETRMIVDASNHSAQKGRNGVS